MVIDTILTKAKAKNNPLYDGKRYCFVYHDRFKDTSWDGSVNIYNLKEKAISVLFTEEQMKSFQPNSTVHTEFNKLRNEQEQKIEKLKSTLRKKRNFKGRDEVKKELEFHEHNMIVFLEIDFIKDESYPFQEMNSCSKRKFHFC